MALTRIRAYGILDSDFKQSCRVTSTTNITLSGGAPNSVDDVNLSADDRVLVQGQNTATENGIYRVSVLGTGSNGTWVRSVDATQAYALSTGTIVYVEQGTAYGNRFFYINTVGNIEIGTTNITFSNFSALPSGGNAAIQFNNGDNTLGGATYLFYNKTTGNLYSNSSTTSTSTTTGAIVAPSLGISGNAYIGNIITTSGIYYPNGTTAGGGVSGGANTMIQFSNAGVFGGATYLQYNYVSGNLVSNSTTTSTSTTTGAIVVGGGVGIGGNLYVGGNLSIAGNTTFINAQVITTTDTFAAPIINAGTIGNSGALLQGTLVAASASQPNITSVGTLTSLTTSGNITAQTANVYAAYVIANTATQTARIVSTGNITATTANVYASNVVANSGVYSAQYYWANGNVFSSGGGTATVAGGNTMLQFSNAGVSGGATFLQYNYVSGNLVSNANTSTTSANTGAIVVSGGIGVGGNIYANGNVTTQTMYINGISANISGVNYLDAFHVRGYRLYGSIIGNTGSVFTGANASFANTTITANTGNTLTRGVTLITADGTYNDPNNPGVMLQITGQTANPARLYIDGVGAGNYSAIVGRQYRGTSSSPSGVSANDTIMRYGAIPYTTTGWPSISTTRMDMIADETQTGTARGSRIEFWITPTSTTTITKVANINTLGLTVTGNVIASNVTTTNGVFYPNGTSFSSPPQGANTMIQFNDGGFNFGGTTFLQYNKTSGNLVSNSTTSSYSTTAGALVVAGGMGVAGNVNSSRFQVGTLTYSDTNILSFFQSSAGTYNQIILQNGQTNPSASASYIVSNDVGTASTFYGDFGMNSSTYNGTGSLNIPSAVFLTSVSSELAIGTTTANGIHFIVNNGSNTTDSFAIFSNATSVANTVMIVANTTTSTTTTAGALQIRGGVGVSGNVYVSNVFPSANNAGGLGIGGTVNQYWANSYVTDRFVANVIAPITNAAPSLGTSTAMFLNQFVVNSRIANSMAPTSNAVASFGTSGAMPLNVYGVNYYVANVVLPIANVVPDIGTAQATFGDIYGVNFFGTATTAKYADLAEMYHADDHYLPGTVMIFGGDFDVTISKVSHDTRVAGVISTNPAYLMNDNFESDNWLPVALTGRVPCNVQGPVEKGDLLVSSDNPGVAIKLEKTKYDVGCVIGKSLDTIKDNSIKKIEIAVGRF